MSTIIEMLEYAGLSYKDIQPKLNNEKLIIIDDKNTDVQCYIRKRKNNLIIAFRGSDSVKDWITDFKFWRKKTPYGNNSSKIKIHSGFLEAYKSKNVRDTIQGFINNDIEKIQVTGHSYGAALATLCAIDLEYNFPDKDYEVVLFGSPRVGNAAFQKSYNKRIFKTLRVENKADAIIKLPFAFLGFRHVGTKISIGNPINYILAPSIKKHQLEDYYKNFFL